MIPRLHGKFAFVLIALAMALTASAVSAQLKVAPSNQLDWQIATTTGGTVDFVLDGTAPGGNGALSLTTINDNNSRAAYGRAVNVPLSGVTQLSYWSKTNAGIPEAAPAYRIGVYLDGTPATFTNLVFEPYFSDGTGDATPVVPGTWQNWDVAAGLYLWSSATRNAGGACQVTNGAGGPPFYSFASIKANCPNAIIVSHSVGQGSYNPNWNTYVDLVNFNGTTWDFNLETVVDDDLMGSATDCDASDPAHATIQAAINAAAVNDIIKVCPGAYNEDVAVNKAGLKVLGSGAATTTVSGPIGGGGSTFALTNNVELSGFTITRDGNNTTDWNNAGLNSAGISIQGVTGTVVHDNVITGMRTAIDINNSNGNTVRNNVIDNNHTGMIMRNQTDNLTVVENFITNNRTVGVLFLDASSGSNVPVQTCANCTFSNNNISGNWYGEIVDRQSGGSLPAPGTNLKNFRGNWFGSTSPVVSTANSAEPGYAVHIPVAYGGTATDPGGQPDIAGPASANFKYTPFLNSGTDTNIETTPGRGTFGFQGGTSVYTVTSSALQGWLFYNDENDTIDNSLGSFIFGPGTTPAGIGSAQISVTGTQRRNLATYQFSGTSLADITTLKFSTYNPSAGNGGSPNTTGFLHFNVDFNGTDTWQRRLVFLPSDNGAIAQNTWQEWDTVNGGNALWRYSGPAWPAGVGGGGEPGTSTKTWNQVLSQYPGVRMRVTDSFTGIRVGNPDPLGYTENLDLFKFGTAAFTSHFDFEPTTPTVTINQAAGQADPTGTAPINFTVTFSEPVSGFTDSDVTLGGATGANTVVVTGGPTVYNVAVSGMNADGILAATINAGMAQGVFSGAPNLASTSTDNSVHFFITCVAVSMPAQNKLTGESVTVPVTVGNMTSRNAISTDFTVTYNQAVLTYTGAAKGTVGTSNGDGRLLTVNATNPGTLVISLYGSTEFQGAGSLVDLSFTASGLPGTSTNLTFTSFKFNEGFPCVTPTNGSVSIVSGTISGTITYGNAADNLVHAVPGVTVTAAGSPTVSDVTVDDGSYSLNGMGAGAYTVTPSKAFDVVVDEEAVSGLDASDIAKHVVGIATLGPVPQQVADVSGNNEITSFDAAMIATYVANFHVSGPNTGSTGLWKFSPVNRTYPNVNSSVAGEDYVALLMGDVTGNWDHPSGDPHLTFYTEGDPLMIGAASVSGRSGTAVSVPVTIGDTTGLGIRSYQFDILYDADVLEPAVTAADLAGTVSQGRSLTVNAAKKGILRVVTFGAMPLEGEGELLRLNFNVIGAADTSSALRWNNVRLNEGGIKFQANNGAVNVLAAAENGSINGRLLDPRGRGVGQSRVTVTDTQGNQRSVMTSTLGYFQLSQLQVGETYRVQVASRRYRFEARSVSITDGNAVELQMIGLE